MKTIAKLKNRKIRSFLLLSSLLITSCLFSSCEELFKDTVSIYEGRWEINAMVSNITGTLYECYGIIDVETENKITWFYMDLETWPYYSDYGTIEDDIMYLEGEDYYAILTYEYGELFIDTSHAGFDLSFIARPVKH